MWIRNILRLLFTRGTGWRLKRLAFFNILATLYFIVMNSVAVYLMVFEILPYLFASKPEYYWSLLGFFLFLVLNVIGNALLVIRTDCSLKTFRKMNTGQTTDKWVKKCDKCLEAPPPRCHHCPMCDECVLKRDHHCFFLGVCVGLQNERCFILLTQYLMMATFFTAVLIIMYINRVYGTQFQGMLTVFTLLPKALFGYFFDKSITSDQILYITMFYGSFTAGLSNAGLFLWQLLIAINGQTAYEMTAGINKYSGKSYWRNFTDVFGPYWFISWFLPINIPQGDLGSTGHRSVKRRGQTSKKSLKHKQKAQ